MRRRAFLAGAAALLPAAPFVSRAQDVTFFRILTGGTVGTYFPIGGLIANAISNPPGSRPCAEGGSCGVPGLVATSVTSNGSVANVAAIPSLVVCGGFTAAGLPLGLEIMGPPWSEATVLRLGHQFERAAGTRDRRPTL